MKYFLSLFLLLFAGTLFLETEIWMESITAKWCCFHLALLIGGGILFINVPLRYSLRVHKRLIILFTIFGLWIALRNISTLPSFIAIITFEVCCFIAYIIFTKSLQKLTITACFLIITVLCFLQASYGILQYFGWFPPTSSFPISGSFDNPAGFAICLSMGLPFGMYFFKHEYRILKYSSWFIFCIIVIAILLSNSRLGMLAFILIPIYLKKDYLKRISHTYKLYTTIILVSLIVGFYFYKKDSSDGRILIWNCTSQIIKNNFWIGSGKGSFQADYMTTQAKYFEKHPDSKFSALAGEVKYPFNEFLLLWVEYGIIGIIVLALIIWLFCKKYHRHPSPEQHIAFASLIALGCFTLFSYPFRYPSTWVFLIFNIALITSPLSQTKEEKRTRRLNWIAAFIILGLSLNYITNSLFEHQWKDIATRSVKGEVGLLPQYQKLYHHLKMNPSFLYNYGAELNVAGQYSESIKILSECEILHNSYGLQMLIADSYMKAKEYESAVKHYHLASLMCPSRFMPLYQLTILYREINCKEKFLQIANQIINKPVKIASPEIERMKNEMKILKKLQSIK